jgi:hypothetical protein
MSNGVILGGKLAEKLRQSPQRPDSSPIQALGIYIYSCLDLEQVSGGKKTGGCPDKWKPCIGRCNIGDD